MKPDARTTTTDGHLPATLRRLDNAIADLFDPQPHQQPTAWTPSLYTQLAAAIGGTNRGNGHQQPGSSPPVNLDAVQLKTEIDTALGIWKLDIRKWRPQDCRAIDQITHNIEQWCRQIRALIDPPRTATVAAPCPNCNADHTYRINSSGDRVRQPALQITDRGCTCLQCRTTWTPDRYTLLCRVLGYEMPKLTSI